MGGKDGRFFLIAPYFFLLCRVDHDEYGTNLLFLYNHDASSMSGGTLPPPTLVGVKVSLVKFRRRLNSYPYIIRDK